MSDVAVTSETRDVGIALRNAIENALRHAGADSELVGVEISLKFRRPERFIYGDGE